jgi:hypothetical protein
LIVIIPPPTLAALGVLMASPQTPGSLQVHFVGSTAVPLNSSDQTSGPAPTGVADDRAGESPSNTPAATAANPPGRPRERMGADRTAAACESK